jgi:hypothetical protein
MAILAFVRVLDEKHALGWKGSARQVYPNGQVARPVLLPSSLRELVDRSVDRTGAGHIAFSPDPARQAHDAAGTSG